MKVRKVFLLLLPVLLFAGGLFGQENRENLPPGPNAFNRDSIPDLTYEPDSTLKEMRKKKKKQKRNFFYGRKAKKGYTRQGANEREVVELFYCLKKHEEPTGYIDELYVWDLTKGKVVKVKKDDLAKLKNYKLLHGPYTRYVAGRMMETGIFYVGTKHGRWEKYKWEKKWWEPVPDRRSGLQQEMQPILIGKTKYYKGWQKEARISYYDFERTKVKEVIPFEYGEQTGEYFYFLENGQVLTKGAYEVGKKVGVWVDYFEDKNRKKRETQYPTDQWDSSEPVVLKEWDSRGNVVVLNGKEVAPGNKAETDPIKKALRRKK
jgi:hypothetical protein